LEQAQAQAQAQVLEQANLEQEGLAKRHRLRRRCNQQVQTLPRAGTRSSPLAAGPLIVSA